MTLVGGEFLQSRGDGRWVSDRVRDSAAAGSTNRSLTWAVRPGVGSRQPPFQAGVRAMSIEMLLEGSEFLFQIGRRPK